MTTNTKYDFSIVKEFRRDNNLRQMDLAQKIHDIMPPEIHKGLSVESLAIDISHMETLKPLSLKERRRLFIWDAIKGGMLNSPTRIEDIPEIPLVTPVEALPEIPTAKATSFVEAYDQMIRDMIKDGRILQSVPHEKDPFTNNPKIFGLLPYGHDPALQSYPLGSIYLSLYARITSHPAMFQLISDHGLTMEQAVNYLISTGRMTSRKHPYGKSMVGRVSSWRVFMIPGDVVMERAAKVDAPSKTTSETLVETPEETPVQVTMGDTLKSPLQVLVSFNGVSVQDALEYLKPLLNKGI